MFDDNQNGVIVSFLIHKKMDKDQKQMFDDKIEKFDFQLQERYEYELLFKEYWNVFSNEILKKCIEGLVYFKDSSIINKYSTKFILQNQNEMKYIIEIICKSFEYSAHFVINLRKEDYTNNDDIEFEEVKIKLKHISKEILGVENCYWIEDTQSTNWSQELYREIHLIENKLRHLINLIMIERMGTSWEEEFKKTKKLKIDNKSFYKESVQSFRDIEDFLLHFNTDDLLEIMDKSTSAIDIKQIDKINELINSGKTPEVILQTIKSSYTKDQVFYWENIFGNFFHKSFKESWILFSNTRNQIAHNKFIDLSFYKKSKSLNYILSLDIQEANIEINIDKDDFIATTYDDSSFIDRAERINTLRLTLISFIDHLSDVTNETSNYTSKISEGLKGSSSEELEEWGRFEEEQKELFYNSLYFSVLVDFHLICLKNISNNTIYKIIIRRKQVDLYYPTQIYIEFFKKEELLHKVILGHSGFSIVSSDDLTGWIQEDNEFIPTAWEEFKDSVLKNLLSNEKDE